MDRRGFVTSGMAAGLAGFTGASGALGTLLDRAPGFARGKTLANGDIRLSSNENPLGVSPAARQAIIDAIVDSNRYGGRRQEVLDELSRYLGVKTENLTLGFGSIAKIVYENWEEVFNGARGIDKIARPGLFGIEMDIGRVSGLICGENSNPLTIFSLANC